MNYKLIFFENIRFSRLQMKTCEKKHNIKKCKTCWMEKRYSLFKGHPTRCLCYFSIPELEKIRWFLMKSQWHIDQLKKYNSLFHANEAMKSKITALMWLKIGDNYFSHHLLPKLESFDESRKWFENCMNISNIFSDKMLECVIKMENSQKKLEE